MQVTVNQSTLEFVSGDITAQDVDAIVNAANSALSGGGGVDGAIHRAAGPELLAECRTLGRCPTGEARITKGYRLKARYVIHAVGPVYTGQTYWDEEDAKEIGREAELLASAFHNSLVLASQHGIKSVAFPAISTGIYGYPKQEGGQIALKTVKAYLEQHSDVALVRFVLWDGDGTRAAFERAAARVFAVS